VPVVARGEVKRREHPPAKRRTERQSLFVVVLPLPLVLLFLVLLLLVVALSLSLLDTVCVNAGRKPPPPPPHLHLLHHPSAAALAPSAAALIASYHGGVPVLLGPLLPGLLRQRGALRRVVGR